MATGIVESQLISAAMLQDPLISKLGLTLANGTIIFEDEFGNPKNWYYQTGTGTGPFSYVAGANPLTLSAAGTFIDVSGNDVIPFWYPYSESDNTILQPYFIQVYDQFGTFQFPRTNFPFTAGGKLPVINYQTLDNLIINNRFWRNVGTVTMAAATPISNVWTYQYNDIGTYYYQTLAPNQHDGFSMPDINFIKNNYTAADTITFTTFPLTSGGSLTNDIQPEFYINHTCSSAGTGESLKVYQFPISLHVNTLNSVDATFSIQAQAVGSSQDLTFYIYQFLGTGVASGSPILIGTGAVTITTTWTQYPLAFTFPATNGLTLSSTGDDALYLQIAMPLNSQCNINFTLPSIYLGNTVPQNSFSSYDVIDGIVNTPRTGDVRTSLNTFYPYGWQPMDNATIGNTNSSGSNIGAQYWPLYNLLWQSFDAYNTGTANPIAQMFSSPGAGAMPIGYGATAYADWLAGNSILLTNMLGRVILGTVPVPALGGGFTTTFTASSNIITTTNNVAFYNGMPVTFTGTSTLSTSLIYYVTAFNGTTSFGLSTTFAQAMTRSSNVTVASDSGIVIGSLVGTIEGEYAHAQLPVEVGVHSHASLAGSFVTTSGSVAVPGSGAGLGSALTTANNQASVTPMNVTQPGVYMNIFIKL